jgi:hypothetical protein
MKESELIDLKNRFSVYAASYKNGDKNFSDVILLKEKHTFRVCNEIKDLCISLSLSDDDIRLSETIALLHDLGRFEQYKKYGTFSDFNSENHAVLAVKIIEEKNILAGIVEEEADIIRKAVLYHNKAVIPEGCSEKLKMFAGLIRDADKLDIYGLVTKYYASPEKNEAIELNLPDNEEISFEVCEDILNGRIVNIANVRTLNDFKLLQTGWVFDINFKRTYQEISRRGYIDKIIKVLPDKNEVREISDYIKKYLSKKQEK